MSLHKKWSFPLKISFSRCDQIRSKLWIWSYLLKKSLLSSSKLCGGGGGECPIDSLNNSKRGGQMKGGRGLKNVSVKSGKLLSHLSGGTIIWNWRVMENFIFWAVCNFLLNLSEGSWSSWVNWFELIMKKHFSI